MTFARLHNLGFEYRDPTNRWGQALGWEIITNTAVWYRQGFVFYENVVRQSDNFYDSSKWTVTNATILSAAADKPAVATDMTPMAYADGLVETAATGVHTVAGEAQTGAASNCVFSVYVRKENRDWFYITHPVHGTCWFDLTDGVLGTSTLGSDADPTIESVGGGWFRCAIGRYEAAGNETFTLGSATADNTTSFAGDATKVAVYLWGAMATRNTGVRPTAYNGARNFAFRSMHGVETYEYSWSVDDWMATFDDVSGIYALFDTAGATDNPHEDYEQQWSGNQNYSFEFAGGNTLSVYVPSNLYAYSHRFDLGDWVEAEVNVSNDVIGGPFVNTQGDAIYETTSDSRHEIGYFVVPQSTTLTQTAYVKAGSRDEVRLRGSNPWGGAYFNLTTKTVGTITAGWSSGSASITELDDGWFLLKVTRPITTPGSQAWTTVSAAVATEDDWYVGNGSLALYVSAATAQEGDSPEAYVYTNGTAADGIEGFDDYEAGWGNANFISAWSDMPNPQSMTTPVACTFDTTPEDYEDYEEEWWAGTYHAAWGTVSSSTCTFDDTPENYEDYEEDWDDFLIPVY